jgi:hypothetical protein
MSCNKTVAIKYVASDYKMQFICARHRTLPSSMTAYVTYIKLWELIQNGTQFFVKCLLRKFDLSHVKLADASDLKLWVDDCRRFALRSRQHNVDEILVCRHRLNALEVVNDHSRCL